MLASCRALLSKPSHFYACHLHTNHMRQALFLSPLFRWEHYEAERVQPLARVTVLISREGTGTESSTEKPWFWAQQTLAAPWGRSRHPEGPRFSKPPGVPGCRAGEPRLQCSCCVQLSTKWESLWVPHPKARGVKPLLNATEWPFFVLMANWQNSS